MQSFPFKILTLLFAVVSLSSFVLRNQAEEFGKASYYADSLHGRKTASGEKYDKNEYTCAHKTFPFGTKLRITLLDNSKSVIVRVNDRGPFREGHVVDLSRRAAQQIGLIDKGIARVKVEVVKDENDALESMNKNGDDEEEVRAATTNGRAKMLAAKKADAPVAYSAGSDAKPAMTAKGRTAVADAKPAKKTSDLYKVNIASTPKKGFGVQVSTLSDADNVLPILQKLEKKYAGKVLVNLEQDAADNTNTYKVVIGPYGDRKAAQNALKAISKTYKEAFVVDLTEL